MNIKLKDQYSLVALLPMKANSERIKGKNFKSFCGKPLFRWVLDTLLSCKDIELIVINTDAVDILNDHSLENSKRILIRQRPISLCGDFVSMNNIIKNDIENISSNNYLMTHTTNPFLSKVTIEKALKKYIQSKEKKLNDSLFTVNVYQNRFYKENGDPINHDPSKLLRTQDLEKWLEENSNLYIFSKESFLKTNNRIGKNPILFETPKKESIDIDNKADWEFASLIMQSLINKI
tara:strand:- start:307 stop:1011 length:705 start_codon:yes stop_codon:yes gene_type:complete